VRTNGWDPALLARFRADPTVGGFLAAIDSTATVDQLEAIAEVVPEKWLAPAATGNARECAAAVRAQFDLGVNGVIMHGCTPSELEPVVTEYAKFTA